MSTGNNNVGGGAISLWVVLAVQLNNFQSDSHHQMEKHGFTLAEEFQVKTLFGKTLHNTKRSYHYRAYADRYQKR